MSSFNNFPSHPLQHQFLLPIKWSASSASSQQKKKKTWRSVLMFLALHMLIKHVDTWIMEIFFVVLSTSPLIFPSNLIFQTINTQFLDLSQCFFHIPKYRSCTSASPISAAFRSDFFFPLPFLPPLGIFFFLPFLFWTLFLVAQKSSLNQTSPHTPKLVCNFISSNTNMRGELSSTSKTTPNLHPKWPIFDVFLLIPG